MADYARDHAFQSQTNALSRDRRRSRHAAYQRQWYGNHPNVKRVLAIKDRPCMDCGIALPPEIMELDHVRGKKEFSLSQNAVTRSSVTPEILEAEIAKCDVRCPNCHRLRHYNARPWRGQLRLVV